MVRGMTVFEPAGEHQIVEWVATRYDRLVANYLAFVQLASISASMTPRPSTDWFCSRGSSPSASIPALRLQRAQVSLASHAVCSVSHES